MAFAWCGCANCARDRSATGEKPGHVAIVSRRRHTRRCRFRRALTHALAAEELVDPPNRSREREAYSGFIGCVTVLDDDIGIVVHEMRVDGVKTDAVSTRLAGRRGGVEAFREVIAKRCAEEQSARPSVRSHRLGKITKAEEAMRRGDYEDAQHLGAVGGPLSMLLRTAGQNRAPDAKAASRVPVARGRVYPQARVRRGGKRSCARGSGAGRRGQGSCSRSSGDPRSRPVRAGDWFSCAAGRARWHRESVVAARGGFVERGRRCRCAACIERRYRRRAEDA